MEHTTSTTDTEDILVADATSSYGVNYRHERERKIIDCLRREGIDPTLRSVCEAGVQGVLVYVANHHADAAMVALWDFPEMILGRDFPATRKTPDEWARIRASMSVSGTVRPNRN